MTQLTVERERHSKRKRTKGTRRKRRREREEREREERENQQREQERIRREKEIKERERREREEDIRNRELVKIQVISEPFFSLLKPAHASTGTGTCRLTIPTCLDNRFCRSRRGHNLEIGDRAGQDHDFFLISVDDISFFPRWPGPSYPRL